MEVVRETFFCGDRGCSGRRSVDEWCGRVGRRESGSSSEILVSLIPSTTFENSASASGSMGTGGAFVDVSGGTILMGSPKEIVELINEAVSSSMGA